MKTFIVDSFTNIAFKGNPAGVCFPATVLTEENMQLVAMELGLSETAFVQPTDDEHVYTIRYFSPQKEIPLCGHATLAAAKILFGEGKTNQLYFITVEHLRLSVVQKAGRITMEFPVYNTVAIEPPADMLVALGITTIKNAAFSEKNNIILLEIESARTLAALQPDFAALVKTSNSINGVLITSASNDGYDYHYRYFWPWAGTNEDPVTGGVQTFLAKYWSLRLGKKQLRAFQSSARTGFMELSLQEDKVLLTGEAVVILEGNLTAFDKKNSSTNTYDNRSITSLV